MKDTELGRFMGRMERLGIKIELIGNFPWIYVEKINGKRVTERFHGNHGFTIAFSTNEKKLTDIKEVFKLIRKYR